jgi:2-C-methyl-D-erythritol 2,4-cyclodiphosphate synthase
MNNLRIGHGYDVHRLVVGRKLKVGGVEIPFEKGLEGHSDADVLLHAVADAILGAVGLPDIGRQFPPGDDRFKDADSLDLLRQVLRLARDRGLREVISVDSIIMAERPKMNPHISTMKRNIVAALEIDISRVGLKATTCEGLGFVGREEGMAASAVCLIALDG